MEILNKIILGIIQGVTELLPVSSSGHLILAGNYMNVDIDLPFLTFLHLMTGLAIVLGFWDEIKYVFTSKNRKYLLKILLVGIVPAGIFAALFSNQIENYLHNVVIVIISLIFWGIVMILVDSLLVKKAKKNSLEEISSKKALTVGVAQILALIPGTSRSGISILSGISIGIERKTAIAFSFLIGLPLILGAFFLEVAKDTTTIFNMLTLENLLAGLIALIFGFFSIRFLKKIANRKFLTFFGIYRIILGISILLFMAI
jgi:undecaprenyl-diphosphatase